MAGYVGHVDLSVRRAVCNRISEEEDARKE